MLRVIVLCCFKACQHQLCTTAHHHGVIGAATVPCRYRGVPVVRPRHALCECWSPTQWSASGSAPLESRLLNLDSTLQQIKPLAFWQYLTLRVVYYVLHICAPQAGYMPQYSSVAVIFVDQSLFLYWREHGLITLGFFTAGRSPPRLYFKKFKPSCFALNSISNSLVTKQCQCFTLC